MASMKRSRSISPSPESRPAKHIKVDSPAIEETVFLAPTMEATPTPGEITVPEEALDSLTVIDDQPDDGIMAVVGEHLQLVGAKGEATIQPQVVEPEPHEEIRVDEVMTTAPDTQESTPESSQDKPVPVTVEPVIAEPVKVDEQQTEEMLEAPAELEEDLSDDEPVLKSKGNGFLKPDGPRQHATLGVVDNSLLLVTCTHTVTREKQDLHFKGVQRAVLDFNNKAHINKINNWRNQIHFRAGSKIKDNNMWHRDEELWIELALHMIIVRALSHPTMKAPSAKDLCGWFNGFFEGQILLDKNGNAMEPRRHRNLAAFNSKNSRVAPKLHKRLAAVLASRKRKGKGKQLDKDVYEPNIEGENFEKYKTRKQELLIELATIKGEYESKDVNADLSRLLYTKAGKLVLKIKDKKELDWTLEEPHDTETTKAYNKFFSWIHGLAVVAEAAFDTAGNGLDVGMTDAPETVNALPAVEEKEFDVNSEPTPTSANEIELAVEPMTAKPASVPEAEELSPRLSEIFLGEAS